MELVYFESSNCSNVVHYVSHNFKLVRASVDGVTKKVIFPSYKVKGSSSLSGFCHGAENRY